MNQSSGRFSAFASASSAFGVDSLWRGFRRRVLPMLRNGVIAGSALLFPLSFDASEVFGQFSLTGTTYSQSFDGLGTTTQTVAGGNLANLNASLTGWYFFESGGSANTTITAGTGSLNAGDTYNFGLSGNVDRAIGGLRSGSVVPSWGFWFTNNTGREIKQLSISYLGQTWRVGTANRSDQIDFGYSSDATALNAGTWIEFNSLDYANPGSGTTGGTTSNPLHSAAVSNSITGLAIGTGANFFIRWTDLDASGADDGMGVNNFSMTAVLAASPGYWDANGGTGGVGGNGTWDSSSASFSSSLAGTDPATRGDGDLVVFAGTAGGVTVSGNVNANAGMNFATTGYALSGGTINLGGTTILDNDISVDPGVNATISSVISGTTGLAKSRAGALELSGQNTFSGGLSIGGGSVVVSAIGNLGDANNDITLTGGTLVFSDSVTTGAGMDFSGTGGIQLASGKTLAVSGSYNVGSTTIGGGSTVSLDGSTRGAGVINFDGNGTLNGSGAISSTGITVGAVSGAVARINPDVSFASGDRSVVVGGGASLELNGNLSAAGYLLKQGGGTLTINGNLTSTGGIRIGAAGATPTNGGQVIITSKNSVGSGAVQHNFGTLSSTSNLTGANALTVGLSVGGRVGSEATIGGTNDIEFTGSTSFFRGAGTSGLLVLNVNNNLTLSAVGVTTGGGTTSGIRLGGSSLLTIKGNGSLLTDNITVADTLDLVIASTGTLGSGAGAFSVEGGASLINNGSISASLLTVASGGSYSGNGDLNAGLTIADGGRLAPGNSVGTTTVLGALELGGTYDWEIDTVDSGIADLVIVDAGVYGNLTLGPTSVLNIVSSNFNEGDEYTLFAYSGDLTGTFNSILLNGGSLGTYQVSLDYAATTAGLNDPGLTGFRYVTANITAVPEPNSMILLVGGALAGLALRRRKNG
jgi:hypothetical protein